MVLTNFIRTRHNIKPKHRLVLKSIMHELTQTGTAVAMQQVNIIAMLLDEQMVQAQQFLHDDKEQHELWQQTLEAWNGLANMLTQRVPEAVMTAIPNAHNA